MSIGFGQGYNANIKYEKFCALCKYWDDLACEHAEYNGPGHWNIDPKARERCLKSGFFTYGNQCCPHFCKQAIFYTDD